MFMGARVLRNDVPATNALCNRWVVIVGDAVGHDRPAVERAVLEASVDQRLPRHRRRGKDQRYAGQTCKA